jgi:hypothetical protein
MPSRTKPVPHLSTAAREASSNIESRHRLPNHSQFNKRNEARQHASARSVAVGVPTVQLYTTTAWESPDFPIHIIPSAFDTTTNRVNPE